MAIEYVMPETWRRVCGDDVPIPRYPSFEMRIVSVSTFWVGGMIAI
jgi:hypothetical protein